MPFRPLSEEDQYVEVRRVVTGALVSVTASTLRSH